jgi:hypothetical protein
MAGNRRGTLKVKRFNPTSAHPVRALQAWQVLIGCAFNRQTVTYGDLAKLMYGKKAAGVLAQVLGHVAFFCQEHRLPALTAIVVGHKRGTPGHSIPLNAEQLDSEREAVYAFGGQWFDIVPPTPDEFSAAYANLKGS